MKKLISRLILATLLLTTFHLESFAAKDNITLTVMKQKESSDSDDQEWDVDEKGHRVPAHPVRCTISTETGVTLSGYSVEIDRYDIWNPDGDLCLFTTSDESSFVEEILSSHGTFMIRLYTDACIFTGYISIP